MDRVCGGGCERRRREALLLMRRRWIGQDRRLSYQLLGGRGQLLIEHASLTNKKCQSLGCTAVGCDVEFIWVGINQEIEWRTTKMVDGLMMMMMGGGSVVAPNRAKRAAAAQQVLCTR